MATTMFHDTVTGAARLDLIAPPQTRLEAAWDAADASALKACSAVRECHHLEWDEEAWTMLQCSTHDEAQWVE